MYYEINVAVNKMHLFATAERSITTDYQLKMLLPVIREKFQASDGYSITVTRHINTSVTLTSYTINKILNGE